MQNSELRKTFRLLKCQSEKIRYKSDLLHQTIKTVLISIMFCRKPIILLSEPINTNGLTVAYTFTTSICISRTTGSYLHNALAKNEMMTSKQYISTKKLTNIRTVRVALFTGEILGEVLML